MRPVFQRPNKVNPHPRRTRRWLAMLVLAAVAQVCTASPRYKADTKEPSSVEVEAAYLYNFGKFVRWPALLAHTPLTICVANEEGMSQAVARLVQGEQIGGRALQVKSLSHPAHAGDCAILFIGGTQRERLDAYLGASAGKPVLTVGDAPDFLSRGGIIQFVLTQNHVRFSANLDAARKNHLQLSSELLKVAIQVTGESAQGGLQ